MNCEAPTPPTLGRCATCKHWVATVPNEDIRPSGNRKVCARASMDGDEMDGDGEPLLVAIIVGAPPLDIRLTAMATSPDFGCVLHEPKA